MAGRRPKSVGERIRLYVPPALLLLSGSTLAAVDAPRSSLFYLGAYRIEVGAFLAAVGLVAVYFAARRG